MRLADLARTSGASIPTIKFYIREGLLPPGAPTSARQSDYSEAHVERLRLIRALVDVGGLGLAAVRDVLAAAAGPGGAEAAVVVAHNALGPAPAGEGPPERALRALELLGWDDVDGGGPAVRQLEAALAAVEAVGLAPGESRLRTYAAAAAAVAAVDVADVADLGDGATAGSAVGDPVRYVVLGTVLYEPLLLALRRLAQQRAFRGADPGRRGGQAAAAEAPMTSE